MKPLYIGLMSGTSLDAVDVVLVDFSTPQARTLAFQTHPLPDELREALLRLMAGQSPHPVQCLGELDHLFGKLFASCALAAIRQAGVSPDAVAAIGSHGQTLYHHPVGDTPFTLQIGDANLIAEATGITTVADFRRRDMAAGGQGAPLAPAYHAAMVRSHAAERAVLNIGGMANLTLLPSDTKAAVTGFDTGPGNVLLDSWSKRHLQQPFDRDGEWAAAGRVSQDLLQLMLSDDYFAQSPPKSTGREHFNERWLDAILGRLSPTPAAQDIQATLTELTAQTVADALLGMSPATREVWVCGGGVHNRHLMQRLQHNLPGRRVDSTLVLGIDPDAMEALTFAWLAKQTLEGLSGNIPSVTGARGPRVLGAIYPG